MALRELGIDFHRAQVGDRYVLAMLKEQGGVIGGETSGHILCLDRTTTGDALISALQVLAVMRRTGRSLAQLAAGMQKFPQVMLQRAGGPALRSRGRAGRGRGRWRRWSARWASDGRVVLRASGTEPVIRVMVEGRDEDDHGPLRRADRRRREGRGRGLRGGHDPPGAGGLRYASGAPLSSRALAEGPSRTRA